MKLENENENLIEKVDEIRKPCCLILIGCENSGKTTICGSLIY
jgi:GTPase SAR1 family protein